MADMETTYGGGRSTTTTRGLGAGGGAGMLFDPSMWGGILAQRLKQREEDRAFEIQQRERFKRQQKTEDESADPRGFRAAAGGGVLRAAIPEIGEPAPRRNREVDPYEQKMKSLAYRDALMRSEAAGGPAPKTFVGPDYTQSGFASHYTPDVNRMNAYQRQAYLPSESTTQMKRTAYDPRTGARQTESAFGESGGDLEEFEDQNLRKQARRRALEKMQAGEGPTRVTGWGG